MLRRWSSLLAFTLVMGLGTVARADLVAHFSFDGSLVDAVSGKTGTFIGGDPVYVEGFDGAAGRALFFDGSNDYVIVDPTTPGLPLSDNPSLSVAMWVKGPKQADKRVFSEGWNGTPVDASPLYNIGTDNRGLTATPPNAGALDIFIRRDTTSGTPVNHYKTARPAFDDTWHHIAVVDDNSVITLYIDGVREGQGIPQYVREPLTTSTTTIGAILRAAAATFFNGAIDEVYLYSHALSAEDVLALVPEPEGCPDDGDTSCGGIDVVAPEGNVTGEYVVTVLDAADGSGDPILYIITAESAETGELLYAGPQTSSTATFLLTEGGLWTITARVDDSILCRDPSGVCTTTVDVNTVPPRMIAHLPMDGNLVDATGNGNDGAYVGYPFPLLVTGYDCTYRGAGSFDGVSQYVRLAQADSLPISANVKFTIAMWVKGPPPASDALRDRRIFSEGSTTNNTPLFNIGTDSRTEASGGLTGVIDVFIRGDTATPMNHRQSAGVAFDDTWHHVAWVDNNGAAALYIDGVRDATDFNYTRAVLSSDTTTIAGILRGTASYWFPGLIDDVRLYNYALSEAEIAALVTELPECEPELAQLPGDFNQDGDHSISDVIAYIERDFRHFFLVKPDAVPLPCEGDGASAGNIALLDVSGDGAVNYVDGVFIAQMLFMGGRPPAQGPACVTIPESYGCGAGPGCP
ncbi:MAG: LamG domain-containing protein [Planctomycetes bacterium]|nr:LamG domain-containing protein [Planctomycetota bacterium]